MNPSLVTVVIPFHPRSIAKVNRALQALASGKGNTPQKAIRDRLDRLELVHYLSLAAIDVECPAAASEPPDARDSQASGPAHLLLEATVDGPLDEAFKVLATVLHPELESVLVAAAVDHAGEDMEDLLRRHHHQISPGWRFGRALGQTHLGAPGMTVRRIRAEHCLAEHLRHSVLDQVEAEQGGASAAMASRWRQMSPVQRLNMLRSAVWELPRMKWAFVEEPAPCLPGDPSNPWDDSGYTLFNRQFRKALSWILRTFLWPLWLLLGVAWVLLGVQAWQASAHWLELLGNVLLAFSLLFGAAQALILLTAAFALRRREKRDPTDAIVPPERQVRMLMEQENHFPQNHMLTVSRLKPGLLRRLTLRLAFVVVGSGRFVGAPGFLGINGVIHAARWIRLPGSNQLVFCSNYDGTWESYVADFIADAPSGVTAIWSNCRGFPASRWLFLRGAEQRDKLVNWARRQQMPTRFWYSAYPELSAARIRNNAAIRQGLASAMSDADARDWLTLFGSQVRPPRELELPEVPTLVFGALTTRPHAACLLVRLRGSAEQGAPTAVDISAARAWVAEVEPRATFGPARPGKPAVAVAFASSALRKLGLPPEAMQTFPAAFQQGMATEWRARALGDVDDNAPRRWRWGGRGEHDDSYADVIVLVYGVTEDQLNAVLSSLKDLARQLGHRVVGDEATPLHLLNWRQKESAAEVRTSAEDRFVEPFGFVDGISQPVIRGAPRNGVAAVGSDLVEPGEIVLGYPDNVGEVPPTPGLAARHDPDHFLPDKGCDPLRRRPEFSRYEPLEGERDLGANGTFLVVRQLQQNHQAFRDWCGRMYKQLKDRPDVHLDVFGEEAAVEANARGLPGPGAEDPAVVGARLIASLVLGRWFDGSSRVRNPRIPATANHRPARPDNAFMLGTEDPRGLACPFGAHIRRANPRDTRQHDSPDASRTEIETVNRHRILRIGRRYSEPGVAAAKGKDQGTMFMCLNADIERQFEFVQKAWLLNRSLHGLEDEVDPFLGQLGGETQRRFTVPTPNGPINLPIDVNFVQVVGGAYFFMPGKATLRYLAQPASSTGATAAQEAAASANVASPAWH